MCMWGHAIVSTRHRPYCYAVARSDPQTWLRSSVHMEFFLPMKKKKSCSRGLAGVRFPVGSEDEVQSVSCGCGAPCDDVSAD